MKKPNIVVTVNSGEYKGKTGLLVGYDRDKYYEVLFNDGSRYTFKGYYLDGIEKLQGHQRYLLQYPYPFSKRVLNNKELNQDRKFYTNKGKGIHNKFRDFHIEFEGNLDNEANEEYYYNLNFSNLKKKVRYAMQKGFNFCVGITINKGSSTTSLPLIAYSGNITTFGSGRNKEIITFERGVIKEINKYT